MQQLKPSRPTKRSKKRGDSLQTFNPEYIFDLPLEIVQQILRPLRAIKLIELRLVCKALIQPIYDFCRIECRELAYDKDKVHILKLYSNLCIAIDYPLPPPESYITYSKVTCCRDCWYRGSGLFRTSDEEPDAYFCAFGCRRYYCTNRTCTHFSVDLFKEDLAKLTCFECKNKLTLSVNGVPPPCRQIHSSVPESDRCVQGNDNLAYHACNRCKAEYTRQDEFYDYIYECYAEYFNECADIGSQSE